MLFVAYRLNCVSPKGISRMVNLWLRQWIEREKPFKLIPVITSLLASSVYPLESEFHRLMVVFLDPTITVTCSRYLFLLSASGSALSNILHDTRRVLLPQISLVIPRLLPAPATEDLIITLAAGPQKRISHATQSLQLRRRIVDPDLPEALLPDVSHHVRHEMTGMDVPVVAYVRHLRSGAGRHGGCRDHVAVWCGR